MDVNYGVLKRLDGLSQFQMVNFFSIFYQISTDSIWYLIERFCSWTTLTMWTDPRGSIFESFSTDKDWASMTSCNLFKFSLSLIYLRLAGLRSWCIYFTCIKTIPQLKNRRVSKSKLFHLVERMVSPRRSFFFVTDDKSNSFNSIHSKLTVNFSTSFGCNSTLKITESLKMHHNE